jgi:DNA-binding MarR family transcriptional regulator
LIVLIETGLSHRSGAARCSVITMRPRRPSPHAQAPTLHNLLSIANRQATSELRRMVSAEGLPVEFWRVLEVLGDEQGRSMSQLAEQTGMQLPAMSKLIDRMTEAALVQRSVDAADQRRVILHISDFGLQKVKALSDDMTEHRNRVGSAFGKKREAQLRELLTEFIQARR